MNSFKQSRQGDKKVDLTTTHLRVPCQRRDTKSGNSNCPLKYLWFKWAPQIRLAKQTPNLGNCSLNLKVNSSLKTPGVIWLYRRSDFTILCSQDSAWMASNIWLIAHHSSSSTQANTSTTNTSPLPIVSTSSFTVHSFSRRNKLATLAVSCVLDTPSVKKLCFKINKQCAQNQRYPTTTHVCCSLTWAS